MKKTFRFAFLILFFVATGAFAQEGLNLEIGTNVVYYAPSCKDVFIKKINNEWTPIAQPDKNIMLDSGVERIKVCLGASSLQKTIAVAKLTLNLDIETKCSIDTSRDRYYTSASRAEGYYYCNSAFGGKKGLFGKFDLENPFNKTLFDSEIKSSISLRKMAEDFYVESYKSALKDVFKINPENCNLYVEDVFLKYHKMPNGALPDEKRKGCEPFDMSVEQLFRFHPYGPQDTYDAAALNFVKIYGVKTLPAWMVYRLPKSSLDSIAHDGERFWRKKYDEEAGSVFSQNPNKNNIERFLAKHELTPPDLYFRHWFYSRQLAISEYWSSEDFDGLVPKAKILLTQVIDKEIADEKARQRREAIVYAEAREREKKRIESWQKKLTVGDDTFCGPVIDTKGRMFKISIRVQLPGYGSETWLHDYEIFPPHYGCLNQNGRLSPNQ